MNQPFFNQTMPVEVLVLRRTPVGKATPRPTLLVLHSWTVTRDLARTSIAELPYRLATCMGRTSDSAWTLASNTSFPQRPVIESVSNLRTDMYAQSGAISSALLRFFDARRSARLQETIQHYVNAGNQPHCFAYVLDFPKGQELPYVRLPFIREGADQSGLFRANQPLPITLLNGLLASGLSDPAGYLIAGKI